MPQKIYPAANHASVMRTLDQNSGVGGYSDRKPSKLEQMRLDYQQKLLRDKEEKMVHMYEENQRKAMKRLARNGSGGAGDQMPSHGAGSPTGGKSVREFFNERRRLEAAGGPVPNIDHHYKQAKGYASPGGWSNRTGSGNSVTKGTHLIHGEKKNSAGRDRAQPLAPIQRRPNNATETVPGNGNLGSTYTISHHDNHVGGAHGRSGIPLRQHNSQFTGVGGREENPFQARPRLLKHKPLPPTTNGHGAGDAGRPREGKGPTQPSSLPRYNPPSGRRQQDPVPQPPPQKTQQEIQQQFQSQRQQQQSRQPHPPPGNRPGQSRAVGSRAITTKASATANGIGGNENSRSARNGSGKMSDFQKWQMEQDRAREDRLKKLSPQKSEADSKNGIWGQPDDDEVHDNATATKINGHTKPVINGRISNKDRLNRLNDHRHSLGEEESDGDNGEDEDEYEGEEDIPEEDEDGDEDAEDLIKAQERAILEQIAAKQREVESMRKEREQEEEEEKREMALRKKREAAERARQKKLEEERRKEEEKQRKLEEEEEKQERKREEQRQREEEKRRREDDRRRRDDEKKRQDEERKTARRQAEEEKRFARQQKQHELSSARTASDQGGSPLHSSRNRQPPDTDRSSQAIDDKPVNPAGSDAKFYAQAAASSDAKGSVGSLVPCRNCGRKFAQDRIKKHQDACATASKPRKEFNASMKRVEGTDAAKYAGRNKKPEPPKKKSNWRAQHEQFIQSLRYAKQVTAYEKGGGDLKDLAPPPPSNNPDFVPCPHCGRTFNESAAERHIPRCQSLKTRPPAFNTRKR